MASSGTNRGVIARCTPCARHAWRWRSSAAQVGGGAPRLSRSIPAGSDNHHAAPAAAASSSVASAPPAMV